MTPLQWVVKHAPPDFIAQVRPAIRQTLPVLRPFWHPPFSASLARECMRGLALLETEARHLHRRRLRGERENAKGSACAARESTQKAARVLHTVKEDLTDIIAQHW